MSKLLHNHPELQKKLNLDKHHVIVDREEWVTARKALNQLKAINI